MSYGARNIGDGILCPKVRMNIMKTAIVAEIIKFIARNIALAVSRLTPPSRASHATIKQHKEIIGLSARTKGYGTLSAWVHFISIETQTDYTPISNSFTFCSVFSFFFFVLAVAFNAVVEARPDCLVFPGTATYVSIGLDGVLGLRTSRFSWSNRVRVLTRRPGCWCLLESYQCSFKHFEQVQTTSDIRVKETEGGNNNKFNREYLQLVQAARQLEIPFHVSFLSFDPPWVPR